MAAVVSLLANASAFAQMPTSPVVTIAVNSGPTPNPAGLVNGATRQVVTRLTASVSFNPAAVPYSGTITGPAWQWRTVGATVAGKADGAPLPAPVGSYSSTFAPPTAAAANVNLTFTQPGWWVVTVAAAATYTDTNGATWSGEAYQDIAVIVVSGGGGTNGNGTVSVLPKKSAICAGGIANPVHQTDVMIVVMNASGNPVGNASVQLGVDRGSLSMSMAMTDSTGVCTVTLTSSVVSADPSASSNVGTGTVTAKWVDPMNINTVFGIGTGGVAYEAPSFLLALSPDWINQGQTAYLNAYASYQSAGVPGHRINFTIVAAWDANDNPVPPSLIVPSAYNLPAQFQVTTDTNGLAANSYQGGTAVATLLLRAEDKDVKLPPDGAKPKDDKAVHVNKNDKKATITIDPGQKGVFGDVVPSTLAVPSLIVGVPPIVVGAKHFVTPKYAPDIDGPDQSTNLKRNLWLRAEGAGTGMAFTKNYEWQFDGTDTINGTGPSPELCAVCRYTTARKVTVKLVNKKAMKADDTMHVWVVWATIAQEKLNNPMEAIVGEIKTKNSGANATVDGIGVRNGGWRWVATVSPPALFKTGTDIPNLTKDAPTVPVPGATNNHIGSGDPLAGGAKIRWNFARQVRVRNDFSLVRPADFALDVKGVIFDQANLSKIVINYPTDPGLAIGTDTYSATSLMDDPYYAVNREFPVNPNAPANFLNFPKKVVGQLVDADRPQIPVMSLFNLARKADDTCGMKIEFREFVRLQIGSVPETNIYRSWYRVSDFATWRHTLTLTYGTVGWKKKEFTSDDKNTPDTEWVK